MVEEKKAQITTQIKALIDNLKKVCANYGLGNDGNEFKIITQLFLYKFLHDKFASELKEYSPEIATAESWEAEYAKMSDDDIEMFSMSTGGDTAILKPEHLISSLYAKQDEANFSQLFDDTLQDISALNAEIFSVKTESGSKTKLFDNVSQFINDDSKRSNFCKALLNQLLEFSFEETFDEGFDFFAVIFEYLISDYNKDSGGKYAEYYTPHAVAHIMARILVPEPTQNVQCYDPSAGTGTLLMNLAHIIGNQNCSIYSQDISQKSSNLLRLNLVLNKLVHSIPNIIEGNTIIHPAHKEGTALRKFDYIVSNPPFKLDFSDWHEEAGSKENHDRFFAGVPNIPKAKKDSMEIYLLFIQHIMHSLKEKGKSAIVVPTGFITASTGIAKKIREKMVEQKMLRGVVSMPSNIFATTGTNVSILFLDKANTKGDIVLMDASKLGTKVKEGKNQKTVLSEEEEDKIITTFNAHKAVEDFSVVVSYDEIAEKNFSFSAGQYFDVKIEYVDITHEEFEEKMSGFKSSLQELFSESKSLEEEILGSLEGLQYE